MTSQIPNIYLPEDETDVPIRNFRSSKKTDLETTGCNKPANRHRCKEVIKKDLVVCGDLTVTGKIHNACLELSQFSQPPPTQEVYDQAIVLLPEFTDRIAEDPAMQIILDASYPLAPRLPGVFGYIPGEPAVISLDGGQLYNDHVVETAWKIHGADPSLQLDIHPETVVAATEKLSKWMTERGFQIAPPDTFESNNRQFNFRSHLLIGEPRWLINISFHFGEENPLVPIAVDLVAVAQTEFQETPSPGESALKGVAPYDPDVLNRDARFNYPFRIPLTQDCVEFGKRDRKKQPVVYYNSITRQLTFSVKCIDYVPFSNDHWPTTLPDVEFGTLEYRMKGFQGKFQLTKRDRQNQLISSSFADAEYLLQVSPEVIVSTTEFFSVRDPPLLDLSYIVPFNSATTGNYAGTVISRINGGSPSFDIYIVNAGGSGADVNRVDPQITLSSQFGGQQFENGDNPNTVTIEKLSAPSRIKFFDDPSWDEDNVQLSEDFFANPPIPENVGLFPPAAPAQLDLTIQSTLTHEYQHSVQVGLGLFYNIDGEAQAVGIEYDSTINRGDYFIFRTPTNSRFVSFHARGLWPLLESESDNLNRTGVYFATFGQGQWWQWFAKKYDPLYQVMRRTNDIMATTWQQFQSQIEQLQQNWQFYGGANRLSAKQAMFELYNLDFSDVYRDYAISLSLLRNNDSIPSQYQSEFPFWMSQPAYVDASNVTNSAAYQFWWQEFDTNANPSTASRAGTSPVIAPGGRFNTYLIQLPVEAGGVGIPYNISLEDLSSNMFVVDRNSISTVEVQNTLGRIVVSMHLYTPNIPDNNGTFYIEGPFELSVNDSHVFNLADFVGSGLVRLVVSNVSITDFGGMNNVLIDSSIDRVTGAAVVTTA